MNKLFTFLAAVTLVLASTALALGILLFEKREILKGRAQKLEQTIIQLGATIEAESVVLDEKPVYPERDVDDVSDHLIEDPAMGEYWETFSPELEVGSTETLDIGRKQDQLMTYYMRDPGTLKPLVDPRTGMKVTEGPGTMQEVLDVVVSKSAEQLDRLNDTRAQLIDMRGELVGTITGLNRTKNDLRQAYVDISARNSTIAGLNEDVRQRDETIGECKKEMIALNDTIHERDIIIEDKDGELFRLKKDNEAQEDRIAFLEGRGKGVDPNTWFGLTRGYKGNVASVDEHWQFVVLQLTDEFLAQYRYALEKGKIIPEPDLYVGRKKNGDEEFVTKVRLSHVDPNKRLGVANVLSGWRQLNVRKGDRVYY
ncbi:MAG: hypothetical protein QGI24_06315 [Kiritimatiellia bacterium]|jgi:hypothetical protein|nr:hypothetical protein [Kiritimatiellia bacterium]MDP6848384.1 hypothetical protein [Kiritimatiellia bacterium]